MKQRTVEEARDIIRENPSLIWYTKAYDQLGEKSIVEAVLNYGTWEQVRRLFDILGIKQVSEIFDDLSERKRSNLHYLAKNFYKLYFAKHAR